MLFYRNLPILFVIKTYVSFTVRNINYAAMYSAQCKIPKCLFMIMTTMTKMMIKRNNKCTERRNNDDDTQYKNTQIKVTIVQTYCNSTEEIYYCVNYFYITTEYNE